MSPLKKEKKKRARRNSQIKCACDRGTAGAEQKRLTVIFCNSSFVGGAFLMDFAGFSWIGGGFIFRPSCGD